jgi:3-dehydroquinate synthase
LEKVVIDTANHKSVIMIGTKWKNFIKYVPVENAVIITDSNLLRIYGKRFPDFPILSISPGEKSKKLEVVNDLAVQLLDLGIDRKGFIIGIGGGVVCDIAGFLASVYMRGIGFGFVSTSLLSQVDASVGGKNGVNVGHVKNILGNFTQPEFVVCDSGMLKTLPDEEYFSGLAELIKTGIILDAGLVETIEQNIGLILKRDPRLLTKLIARSVNIKAAVVREDEKEGGFRMILNFGHTFGHAIEAQTGLRHGFAVANGMMIAADLSVGLGILHPGQRDRIKNILDSFRLLKSYSVTDEQLKDYIIRDKKKTGETVNFVLLEKTGKAIVQSISVAKLIEYYRKMSDKK